MIRAVRDSDAYANLLLPVRLERAKLSTADAGLATELTYGTRRRQGYYDAVIALAAGRLHPLDPVRGEAHRPCGIAGRDRRLIGRRRIAPGRRRERQWPGDRRHGPEPRRVRRRGGEAAGDERDDYEQIRRVSHSQPVSST